MEYPTCFLVAMVDWFSRLIIAWKLSVTLEIDFCIEALQQVLQTGQPDIFHSDQRESIQSRGSEKVTESAWTSSKLFQERKTR